MYVCLALKSDARVTESLVAETCPHKTTWLSMTPKKGPSVGSSLGTFWVS